jgi:hypothetical protein
MPSVTSAYTVIKCDKHYKVESANIHLLITLKGIIQVSSTKERNTSCDITRNLYTKYSS